MTKAGWKKRITETATAAGTYRPYFDPVIDTLAGILEKRDAAQKEFEKSGSRNLVKHTNKTGATNIEQNPLLRLVNDLNRDALAYWKELCLTPSSLKKVNEEAMKGKKRNALAEALRGIGE